MHGLLFLAWGACFEPQKPVISELKLCHIDRKTCRGS